MQIQREANETNTIHTYSDTEIKINHTRYHSSFIVSLDKILTDWAVKSEKMLSEDALKPLLSLNPEVIIIGTKYPALIRQHQAILQLSEQQIGVECLTIGAACRTFNILLGELRHVVAGFILPI